MKIANSKKKPEATAKKEAGGNEKLQYFFTWPKFRFILISIEKTNCLVVWSFCFSLEKICIQLFVSADKFPVDEGR
mgnify:CR=1 FL=1